MLLGISCVITQNSSLKTFYYSDSLSVIHFKFVLIVFTATPTINILPLALLTIFKRFGFLKCRDAPSNKFGSMINTYYKAKYIGVVTNLTIKLKLYIRVYNF